MNKNYAIPQSVTSLFVMTLMGLNTLLAQETVVKMEEVQVRADYDREVSGAFLPDVDGTKIHAGKKTSSIDLEQIPEVSMDNYRQVISKTPASCLPRKAHLC